MDDGLDSAEEVEEEEDDEDLDEDGDEEDDEEEDEKMSISDFSNDEEYTQLQVKKDIKDAWTYFEGRQLERAQKKYSK
jgi:hypothetical protein